MRLAWRVSAYGGVMKLRLDAQRDADTPPAAPSAPAGGPAPARGDVQVTSLAGFMSAVPGAVSRVRIPKGGPGV